MIREKALAHLSTASDQDLLRLSAMLRHWETTEANEVKWLQQAVNAEPHVSFEKTNTPRKNEPPPGTACQRIGSETKEKIMSALPAPLSSISAVIGQRQESTSALLRLLWNRNEIKFDGEEYYV